MLSAFTSFLKENYDLIGLGVGFIGVVIGVISLMDEIKKKKKAKNQKKPTDKKPTKKETE